MDAKKIPIGYKAGEKFRNQDLNGLSFVDTDLSKVDPLGRI
ncbi:hypothetical protein ACSYAD_31075 [Acaryochloris marina NIES-2412]